MDKIKEKLHIGSSRRKSQPENDTIGHSSSGHGVGTIEGTNESFFTFPKLLHHSWLSYYHVLIPFTIREPRLDRLRACIDAAP
jgi:hypothetical protein